MSLPDGGYLVLDESENPTLTLFAADGSLRRRIGRSGRGPGELVGVTNAAIVPPDTIAVHTGDAIAYYDTAGRHLHTQRPGLPGGVWYWIDGNRQLLSETSWSRDTTNLHTHLIGNRSTIIASVLQRSFFPRGDSADRRPLRIFAGSGFSFWVGRFNSATLVRSDTLLAKGLTLARQPEWFQPAQSGPPDEPVPPPSAIVGVAELEGDVLLVASSVPAPNWRQVYEPGGMVAGAPAGAGISAGSLSDVPWNSVSETMLEAIDLTTGKVLTASRINLYPAALMQGGLFAAFTEDDMGYPRVAVFSVRLQR
jgi:hypothetical protein